MDPETERASLMAVDREFAEQTEARGVEGWMAFHNDESRNIGGDGNVAIGMDAIRARWTGLLGDGGSGFVWEPEFADVGPDGQLGYTYGSWAITNPQTGALDSRGKYLTVWRKQPDGSWKVATDVGNTTPQ